MTDIIAALDYKRRSRKSYGYVAAKFNISEQLLREYGKRGNASISEPENPQIPTPLHTYGDAVIISDVHAPFQDNVYLTKICELGRHFKNIYILGDLVNMAALSTLGKGEHKTAPEIDIAHARNILTYMLYHFGRITITLGNHDERYTKKYGISFKEFIYDVVLEGKYKEFISVTDYDYIIHNDTWLLGHASDYNKDSSVVPVGLSERYNKSVMIGHQHMVYAGLHNNRHAISLGCTANPDLFWYKQRRLELYPEHVRGFALLIDNQPVVFEEYESLCYNGVQPNSLDTWINEGKGLINERLRRYEGHTE